MLKDNFVDIFGTSKPNTTMQVVVFDKFFRCLYRLKNIPSDWNFKQVAEALQLQHPANQYQAIRLANTDDFYTDWYTYKDGNLLLMKSDCE